MTDLAAPNGSGLTNLARVIDLHDGDRVALVSQNLETTYGEFRDQVAHLRGGLSALGVSDGDRVAIACGNNRYFVISYLATVGLGAVAVPLNPESPAPELEAEVSAVTPVAVVIGPSAVAAWSGLDPGAVPSVRCVIMAEGPMPDGAVSLASLLAADPAPIVDVAPDHPAAMIFTSGTAGPPRAAMLSHRNLTANVEQSLTAADHLTADDVVYGVLPLFHIFGLNVVLGASLTVGATVILEQRFDPSTAARWFVRRRVTVVPGAPAMWVAFSQFDELADDSFASVRLALSGAARLSPQVARRFEARFGIPIAEGYGLTEASPVVTSSAGLPARPGSVGRVVAGQQLRLVGDDGDDVPAGDAGEVWVRGDNVFLGYWNDDEASGRVLVDGWLRTGDIAIVDDDGYVYLVDRAKDLIIVSGFNVFPAEVEDVVRAHPAVAEVAVVGVPHPHTGEAVKAYAVLVEGVDVDEDSLIEHTSGFLARYKCPSKVIFVDHLPRDRAGKLVRRELESM